MKLIELLNDMIKTQDIAVRDDWALGVIYDEETGCYVWCNKTGERVKDASDFTGYKRVILSPKLLEEGNWYLDVNRNKQISRGECAVYYKLIVFENHQQSLEYFEKRMKDKPTHNNICETRVAILDRGFMNAPVGDIPKRSLRNVMFVPYDYFNKNYEKYMDYQYDFIQSLIESGIIEHNGVIQ